MADISTVSARIAQVESEVAEFAKAVRSKRDTLMAELQDHVDSHKAVKDKIEAEVQAAVELMERITPSDSKASAAPQFVLTKKHWVIEILSHWRLIVMTFSVLSMAGYLMSRS